MVCLLMAHNFEQTTFLYQDGHCFKKKACIKIHNSNQTMGNVSHPQACKRCACVRVCVEGW